MRPQPRAPPSASWHICHKGATIVAGGRSLIGGEMVRALFSRRKKWVLTALAVVVAGTATAVALATSGWGVTPTTYVTARFDHTVHMNSDRIKFQTKDPTLVRVQKLEWLPGAYSGWHHHPGVIIVTVQSGSVTVMDSECNTVTYGPGLPEGAVFVE